MPDTPDWVVTRLQRRFASPPDTARTAAAFGRALASRYGSDLLSLKLRSLCSRAAPFVALPGPEGCPHFARCGAFPSALAPFAPSLRTKALWRGCLAQAVAAVLVRGSNCNRHSVTAFPPAVETSAGISLSQPVTCATVFKRFLIAAGRRHPMSQFAVWLRPHRRSP